VAPRLDHPDEAGRLPVIAGAAIAVGGTALAVATLALTILDRESPPQYTLAGLSVSSSLAVNTLVQTVGLVTLSLVCGIIVWRRPRALLSLVFSLTVAFLALGTFAAEYAVHGLVVAPGSLPLADAAAWSQEFLPPLVMLDGVLFLLLFPDGRLKSARWRPMVVLVILLFAGQILVNLDDPYPLRVGLMSKTSVPVTMPPTAWPIGASLSWASGAVGWAQPALAILIAVYVILRLAAARGEARLQLTWFVYAATIFMLTGLLNFADRPPPLDWLPGPVSSAMQDFVGSETAHVIGSWSGLGNALAGMVLVPIAIGFAMVRYRLYEIDVVINRTILFAGLAAFVAAGYGIVVAGLGSLLGQRAGLGPLLTILAIAVVAALLEPVRSRLQLLANLAVYGRRARPYEVLSDFARSVKRAEAADVLLPRMAELLREGTGASKAEVWVRVGERIQLAASSPASSADTPPSAAGPDELTSHVGSEGMVAPVFLEAEPLGALTVTKPRGQPLSGVERRLVDDLAAQAGLVLSRFRLVQDLRDSRARIVAAQDLERRRIERNLHDGAQQRFANALLALGMATAQSHRHPNGRDLVAQASEEVRAGLADLRELARGVHPSLLTESGLRAAIGSLADRSPILTTVIANTNRRFPEAIETTAYYVVAEALANAAKHSHAENVEVCIEEKSGQLRVRVTDDGIGGTNPLHGSGLMGLRDRVAAVGGSFLVSSPKGKGTIISAELPCE
jgi:signal transduction histidine kinase